MIDRLCNRLHVIGMSMGDARYAILIPESLL